MTNADVWGRGLQLAWAERDLPQTAWNSSNVNDPWYNAKFAEAVDAQASGECGRLVREMHMYGIEQFWTLYGPANKRFAATWPWIKGFNGETNLENGRYSTVFTRLWIDQEMKREMGY